MPDNSAVILLMHSVLNKDDELYGNDKWFLDARRFDKICKFISESKEIKCINNIDLFSIDSLKKGE